MKMFIISINLSIFAYLPWLSESEVH